MRVTSLSTPTPPSLPPLSLLLRPLVNFDECIWLAERVSLKRTYTIGTEKEDDDPHIRHGTFNGAFHAKRLRIEQNLLTSRWNSLAASRLLLSNRRLLGDGCPRASSPWAEDRWESWRIPDNPMGLRKKNPERWLEVSWNGIRISKNPWRFIGIGKRILKDPWRIHEDSLEWDKNPEKSLENSWNGMRIL